MTDPPTSPGIGRSSSIATGVSADPSATVRRNTMPPDDGAHIHRRSTYGQLSFDSFPEVRRPRRSSTFSAYSLSEVSRDLHDEIINPGPILDHEETSWRSWLPLTFAVLPPIAGLVFKNGSLFLTDILLLGLSAVFLHWSVTAPWKWYHSAQQVREEEEAILEAAVVDDIDEGVSFKAPSPKPGKEDGTDENGGIARSEAAKFERARLADKALDDLRSHETMALSACFIAPAVSTYLLYLIRNSLSRPSEGLVSDFNLTIFFLAAEISPLSHSIKLIQAHTLHLQRIVHANPYREGRVTTAQWEEMVGRIADLEARVIAHEAAQPAVVDASPESHAQQTKQMHASLVRDVRAAVQPEIDALNRAVRRYEKKARVLAVDTEGRLRDLSTRVDDAISLSAVVASRKNAGQWSIVGWALDSILYCIMLPFRVVIKMVIRALRMVSGRLRGGSKGVHDGEVVKSGRGPRMSSMRVSRRQ
ncbi:hypothetical protein MFIFM68171_10956 [Madurella fahalii]|uniref:Uncharacterized protein n=1 Tax=Madurella fahalii TaxID=1157608 RepID=A0ABQ0GSN1_9PEZI